MQINYTPLQEIIAFSDKVAVPLKNFFSQQGRLLPAFWQVGGYLKGKDGEFFLEDKLVVGDKFYLLFDSFIEETSFLWEKKNYSLAVITLSDKGYAGQREDKSGPLALQMVRESLPLGWTRRYVIPDCTYTLEYLLNYLTAFLKVDLIITSGGTGVFPRDITPEITAKCIDKRLTGFEQAMLINSLKKTPHAMISRAICGLAKDSLIINLPGSSKAVKENLEAILPALPHTLKKFHGDPEECGQGH